MTPKEIDSLAEGDEVYNGAHRGEVVGVTHDTCTIRWDAHVFGTGGRWNTTYAKPVHIAHMELGSKRAFESPVGNRAEEQFTKLLKDTLRELGATPKKTIELLVAHSAAMAASTHQGRISGLRVRQL